MSFFRALVKDSPGLMLVASMKTLFIVNALVIYAAHLLFPQVVVLGTSHLPLLVALLLATLPLTVVCTNIIPWVAWYEKKRKKIFSPIEWSALYLVVNVIGIWLTARGADYLGLGVASWMVALALGAALDVVQGMAMMALGKALKQ